MEIIKRIGTKFIYSLIVLIGISFVVFSLARLMPGNTVRMALGSRAPEWVVEKVIKEEHLDEAIYKQYYYWFKNVLHGNFGSSWLTGRSVTKDIKEFFPATLEVAIYAIIFMGISGLLFGVFSGQFADSWVDNILRVIAYTGSSVPSYIFAIFFMLIFSYKLQILPTMGRLSLGVIPPPEITHLITIDALLAGDFNAFFDAFKHLVLLALALALQPGSVAGRITRAGIVQNIGKEYVVAAKSYGIPNKVIMFKYVLKLSIIPAASIFALSSIVIFVEAFIIETIFNWPGFARYGMEALLSKDLNVISTVVLIVGALFIVANMIVDLVVSRLDPRIGIKIRSEE